MLFHDELEYKFHSSGKAMKKGDVIPDDIKKMIENIRQSERRCKNICLMGMGLRS